MSRFESTLPALVLLVFTALALTPPAAFGCGWWGDGESDGEDSVVVGPDGTVEEASESVSPDQMARLSTAYRQGDGVPRDLGLARQWAQSAAQAGHIGAMNDLGQMLEAGLGGPSDDAVAAHWYGAAARKGIAGAQHSLAAMLREGRGVERDLIAAERWIRRSAMQGHATAALDLSEMIWAGLITARSRDEGCFWWIIASRDDPSDTTQRCREAQPMLSDEELREVRAQGTVWVPAREGEHATLHQGGS